MKHRKSHIVLISLIVALGGFLMGFDASVISGVVKFIEPEFNLSKIQLGWAVSSLTLAATLAMIIAGMLSDRWGRKRVLSGAAVLYALSAILSALSPSFGFLVFARILGGFGVGLSLIIAPMYIAEIAPPKMRGAMVSFNQLNIVLGISVAFFTNYLIVKWGQSDAEWTRVLKLDIYNWRWMLGLEAIPALLYFSALFVVPKSPRWLIMKGRESEALVIMNKAVGEEQARADMEDVRLSLRAGKERKRVSVGEIFGPAFKMVVTIGIVIAVLQQLTGINSVLFYAPMIFEQSGIGTDAAFSQAILVGITNLVFTILAMALIDKIGRKPLLVTGLSGIAISMMVLAWGFNAASFSETDGTVTQINTVLILVAILTFVASFAVSIGPVMWVLFSELFPNRIRAVAISFVGFINSIVSFLVQLIFPWELSTIGPAPTFFIYGIFAAMGLVFILFKVPETTGRSLEDLQKLFIKDVNKD